MDVFINIVRAPYGLRRNGIAMDKRETETLYLDGGIDSVEGRHLSGANGKPASGDPLFREKQR